MGVGAPVVGLGVGGGDGAGIGTAVVGAGVGISVRFAQYASQSNPVGTCETDGDAVVGNSVGSHVPVVGAAELGAGVLGGGVGVRVGAWVVVWP